MFAMIWLASFPRSGNTFFRNVLYYVYGIESSAHHLDPKLPLDDQYRNFAFVKTHELPGDLPPDLQDCPSVYLIRDGRDSMISMAHHRKDIVRPGTDFYNNLLEVVLAQKGSFFGGWSENVRQWTARADLVIRFSDLIRDPLNELEKLRSIIDLPVPQKDKLPSFEDLKHGSPKYGAREKLNKKGNYNTDFFRSGKIGAWKNELPPALQKLVLAKHGETLQRFDYPIEESSGLPPKKRKRILLESSKLFSGDKDGIHRYLDELVKAYRIILPFLPEWDIQLYDDRSLIPLHEREDDSKKENKNLALFEAEFKNQTAEEKIKSDRRLLNYEQHLLLLKLRSKAIVGEKAYTKIANQYRQGPYRRFLHKLKTHATRFKFSSSKLKIQEALANADLIHVPLPQHVSDLPSQLNKLVVTVHDLSHQKFPHFHTEANVALAESGMNKTLEHSANIIAVSEATRNDLLEESDIIEGNIHVCYEAASSRFFAKTNREISNSTLNEKYQIHEGSYFLCLGTIEPRKNILNTTKAFQKLRKEHPDLNVQLVMAGKKGWKTEGFFKDIPKDEKIVFSGFLDDEDLPYVFGRARALCFVSYYEGFGLPAVEAMACSTPIIYGNNSALREIIGPCGYAADPDDVENIMNQMFVALNDEELWQEKSQASFVRSSQFSWLKTALETLDIYDRIIQSR